MRRAVAPDGLFGPNRYGYLLSVLKDREPGRHLDYGCFDGAVVSALVGCGAVSSAVGIDLNAEVVERAKAAGDLDPRVRIDVIDPTTKRFDSLVPDESVDSASLLDVIEHVSDQSTLLRRIRESLRPGGVLVVTVPQQHLFSVLDGGNVKFRFPRLHRWLYLRRHSEQEYDERYVNNPAGLIGDIEREKAWHQHFRRNELSDLLESEGFEVLDVDGAGLFHRPLVYLRRLKLPVGGLIDADMRRFDQCHLFVAARKTDPGHGDE